MSADLSNLDGLFVGQLSPNELEAFYLAVFQRRARRSYEGTSGLLGLAKVRIFKDTEPRDSHSTGD